MSLGLSEDEYLDLSFPELNALIKRWEYDQSLLDLRTGLICAVTANCYRDEKKKSEPFLPTDFGLPFLREPEVIESPKSQTQQEYDLFLHVQAMNKAMGGKEIRG